jgi:hypothetical protein
METMTYQPETHEQYAQRVGPPRVVPCDVDLGYFKPGHPVYWCRTHEYGFNESKYRHNGELPDGDRCPMSRLEEWRQRRWERAS